MHDIKSLEAETPRKTDSLLTFHSCFDSSYQLCLVHCSAPQSAFSSFLTVSPRPACDNIRSLFLMPTRLPDCHVSRVFVWHTATSRQPWMDMSETTNIVQLKEYWGRSDPDLLFVIFVSFQAHFAAGAGFFDYNMQWVTVVLNMLRPWLALGILRAVYNCKHYVKLTGWP